MARPGTSVIVRETPSTISVPADTGTWFVAGLTDKGPTEATLVRSLDEFITKFGARQAYSPLYDSLELFFREGGNRAYVSRVVGPAATSGTLNLLDAYPGGGISLVATANGPGAWSANYKVAVVAGSAAGTFKVQVTDAANVVLEDSGDLLDNAAAVQWAQGSQYIRLALGADPDDPAVHAATALSAGNDDRANIVDASWSTAHDKFASDLGPGQVSSPGRTTTTAWSQLTAHAQAAGRVALLDLPDIATVGTLVADAEGVNSRYAAAFAPWVVIPGVTGDSTRTVPPSALIAGLIARNDPALGTNRPSAGNAGQSRFVTTLSQGAWSDPDRETLNNGRVNVIRRMFNGIRAYGWRSTTNPVTDKNWIDFGNARLLMEFNAEFNEVAENFAFAEIDGQNGSTIGAFHDGLAGICLQHYTSHELFGDTFDDACSVDTGPSVNTLTTIANLELRAVVSLRMAPYAEFVQVEVVKRLVTETVV